MPASPPALERRLHQKLRNPVYGQPHPPGSSTALIFFIAAAARPRAIALIRAGSHLLGASARFEPLDLTDEEGWAAVVAAAIRHFGKLDVLVNNAGISGSAEQGFYSTEAWRRTGGGSATSPVAIGVVERRYVPVDEQIAGDIAREQLADRLRHLALAGVRKPPQERTAEREFPPRRRVVFGPYWI
jgi:hypothetical protein